MIPHPLLGFSDPISSWTHLFAAISAIFAAVVLLYRGRGNPARIAALSIYSFALIFLFSMSGVFHWLERGSEAREVLRRLDHAGIWFLIAATFVPIHYILFRGPWRWAILAGVCSVAILGLVLELVFFDSFSSTALVILFLSLGWAGAASAHVFRRVYKHKSIYLLAAGGLLYSVGAVFDVLGWPVIIDEILGPHEVFHLFVVGAAILHWSFIYRWANHPIANSLLFHVSVLKNYVSAQAVGESLHVEGTTVNEVKLKIKEAVQKRYHSTIETKIRLRFFTEEDL